MEASALLIEGHSQRVVIHSPRYADEGWLDQYTVRLEAEGLSAEAVVERAYSAEDLVAFFRDLEANWQGWAGEKIWKAFDEQLEISAKMSLQGRVALAFRLRKPEFDEGWACLATICFYAGELRELSTRVSQFFGHEP